MRTLVVAVWVFGAFALLAGCGSDDAATVAPTQQTGDGGSTSDASASDGGVATTTTISAGAGGVVRDASGRFVLTIPPGALAADTAITLSVVTKRGNALFDVGDFGPSGLAFQKPATLAIKPDASLTAPAEQELAVALENAGVFAAVEGSSYTDGAASAPIAHFSSFSIIAVPTKTGPNGCLKLGEACDDNHIVCCDVKDPNVVSHCGGKNNRCCMYNGGLCNRGQDCCNSLENAQDSQFITAECQAGKCCSKNGGPCSNDPATGTPCCTGVCNGSGLCP